MREHTIITISRQYGSGGREIAEILAKKMKVRCYDRQIVYLAAEKVGNGDMDVENILEEAYRVPSGHSNFFAGFGIGNNIIPDYNKMYKEQAALIRRIAEKSGVYSWEDAQMQFLPTFRTVIISLFMQMMRSEKKEVKKYTEEFH